MHQGYISTIIYVFQHALPQLIQYHPHLAASTALLQIAYNVTHHNACHVYLHTIYITRYAIRLALAPSILQYLIIVKIVNVQLAPTTRVTALCAHLLLHICIITIVILLVRRGLIRVLPIYARVVLSVVSLVQIILYVLYARKLMPL